MIFAIAFVLVIAFILYGDEFKMRQEAKKTQQNLVCAFEYVAENYEATIMNTDLERFQEKIFANLQTIHKKALAHVHSLTPASYAVFLLTCRKSLLGLPKKL